MKTIPTQYQKIKEKYKDAIVLFRMGEFYEAYGDDARTLCEVTGINPIKTADGAEPEHRASLPFHSLEGALRKLVKKGYKVAICEELEDPRKREANKKKSRKNLLK